MLNVKIYLAHLILDTLLKGNTEAFKKKCFCTTIYVFIKLIIMFVGYLWTIFPELTISKMGKQNKVLLNMYVQYNIQYNKNCSTSLMSCKTRKNMMFQISNSLTYCTINNYYLESIFLILGAKNWLTRKNSKKNIFVNI